MEQLNINQKTAADHFCGPLLVVAGPGSGKTLVIAHRIDNLIKKYNIPPKDILVITFTKTSAQEMKKRFIELTSENKSLSDQVCFGTFHSFFYRILRTHLGYSGENILTDDQRKNIVESIIKEQGIGNDNFDDFVLEVLEEISYTKNNLTPIKDLEISSCSKDEFLKIITIYEEYKKNNNKIDFDDMLTKCYKLLVKNPSIKKRWQIKFCLIDEFQDINRAQFECIKMLTEDSQNLFVVGDDDQSIYKFRGSRPEFLLNFNKNFVNAKDIYLDTNYRSTTNIILLANKSIENNKTRISKNIHGTGSQGQTPILLKTEDVNHEAAAIAEKITTLHKDIPLKETAIIYRTNIQARAFIDRFMDLKIPFIVNDELPNIYDHWINRDIIAYFELSMNLLRDDCLERIVNKPSRYISNKLFSEMKKSKNSGIINNYEQIKGMEKWQKEKFRELVFYLQAIKKRTPYDAIKYLRSAVSYDEYLNHYAQYRRMNSRGLLSTIDELMEFSKQFQTLEEYISSCADVYKKIKNTEVVENSVTLSTMHGAKGLEFELVFIASAIEGVIPFEKSIEEGDIEEERRLFYVGITRAKKHLYISTVKSRYEKDADVSRFVKEIL